MRNILIKILSFILLLNITAIDLFNFDIKNVYASSTWELVGSAGFSAGWSEHISIALDNNGTPYVVYQDDGNDLKATVKRFNGTSWETVGEAGFSAGMVRYTSIAIGKNGIPYVVYRDEENSSKATVMKYNGISWKAVGNVGFSDSVVEYTSIAIDETGIPYVVYQDGGNNVKATVKKYNGTSWENVGDAGFTPGGVEYTSIVIDSRGIPYIVFRDGYELSGYKASVMKYNGSSWENVGMPAFTEGKATYTTISLDHNDNPYIAYQDFSVDRKATVMKYVGGAWEVVGTKGISANWAVDISIEIDNSGAPYIAYKDVGNSDKATVMKYTGTKWESVGSTGFTSGGVNYTSIAIGHSGEIYLAYMDGDNSGKTTVMKYGSNTTTIESKCYIESFKFGVKLNWNKTSAIGYRVFRSETATKLGESITEYYLTSNSFADVNVEPNRTYYYTIKPVISVNAVEKLGEPVCICNITTTEETYKQSSKNNFIILELNNPKLTRNGIAEEIDPGRDTKPLIISGRTMVPIRAIIEAMEGKVLWDREKKQITMIARGNEIKMWLNDTDISINGIMKTMDVTPQVVNGRTYVPVRFVAENLDSKVEWIKSTKEVVLIY